MAGPHPNRVNFIKSESQFDLKSEAILVDGVPLCNLLADGESVLSDLEFIKIKRGDKWAWRFGDWESIAFPYLEDRPWTPILVADTPCFIASNSPHIDDGPGQSVGQQWCVVFGDEPGRWFEDVTNLSSCRGLPVYTAMKGTYPACKHHIVHGAQISQAFDEPVSYVDVEGKLSGMRFSPRHGKIGPPIELKWSAVDENR